MSTLKPGIVNAHLSISAIVRALTTTIFNHEVNKNFVFEEYYVAAIVPIASIRNGTCSLLLFDDETKKFYHDKGAFDLSFLPPKLLQNAQRSRCRYVHVLIAKKVYFYSKIETIKTLMVVPIGQKQIGYFSNDMLIDGNGLLLLNAFLNNRDDAWANVPLPRYSTMTRIKHFMRSIGTPSFYRKVA